MLLSHYRRPLFLILLLYAAGIWVFGGFFIRPPAPLAFTLPRSGAPVEGRITGYPAAGPGGRRFTLESDTIYGAPFKTGLMVYARSLGGASYADRVSFLADLETPPGASVPGGLDWADYLARRGITAQARARDLEVKAGPNAFIRAARGFRAYSLGTFEAGLAPESASVLGGVVLGEKKSVPPELKAAFQDSGAMHLLVASGSNVGFVVAVVYFMFSRLGVKRRYSGLAALALAGFYVIAAGFDSPLVRAYLMFAAGLCAYLLRREAGAFHALTVAGLAILAVSPEALFDAGFQMSFLAAYGLAVGMSLWGKYLPGGAAGKVAGLFMVSFFAQLGLYPLLAVYFHKVSLVSLLSNMILVPAAGVAMALGFLLTLFAKSAFIFKYLAPACGRFMEYFIGAVRFFAALPYSSVRVAEPSAWFVAGYFISALALLHAPLLGFRTPRLYLALALGLVVMACGPRGGAGVFGPAGYTARLFGDANTAGALISAPSGEIFLVNPGVSGKKLAESVFAAGRRSVEAVLLTSTEEGSYSGLAELAGIVTVKRVLLPYGPRPAPVAALFGRLKKGGAEIYSLWPGEKAPGGLDIAAAWGGEAGYSGAGRGADWLIGPVRISAGGNCAGPAVPLPGGPAPVCAGKGKTAELRLPPR